jgi:hypothetical protein
VWLLQSPIPWGIDYIDCISVVVMIHAENGFRNAADSHLPRVSIAEAQLRRCWGCTTRKAVATAQPWSELLLVGADAEAGADRVEPSRKRNRNLRFDGL